MAAAPTGAAAASAAAQASAAASRIVRGVAEDRDWALRHLETLNLPSDLKAVLSDVEAFDAACEVRVA
jgi:hypothetical protein